MAIGEPQDDGAAGGRRGQSWRPSMAPAHRLGETKPTARIVEESTSGGPLGAVRRLLSNTGVRIVLGLALFVAAAIAFDALTGSGWGIKPEPLRPAPHASSYLPETPE